MTAEVAEEYCLGRLAGPAVAPLEGHLLVCCNCARVVQETLDYIEAFRAAKTTVKKGARSAPKP